MLDDAGDELLVDEVFTTGIVDVIKVDVGFVTTDAVLGEATTALLELEALTMTEEETFTPELVEPAITGELAFKLVDALVVEVATTELTVDFVDALVVEAGTEGDVVLTTAALLETAVPLTPFGEAGDQNAAGV